MEEKSTQYIEAKFPSDGKRGTSGVKHAAYAHKIKQCIKNPENFPKEFRYFVERKFSNFLAAISRIKRCFGSRALS